MTFANRIRRASALIAVFFCVSLISPTGAFAGSDQDKAGGSSVGQEKREDAPGNAGSTTSPAPDESTTVAIESGAPASNGKADESNGNSKKDPDPVTTTAPTTTTTITTTTTAPLATSGGGGSTGGKSGNAGGKSGTTGGGGGNTKTDPDPAPIGTPPSTTGPNTCDGSGSQKGGPYDHDNCDGSQGQNGNGGNGKCAGCTGGADDKGPRGQFPGDHNNGYECDHNRGVGKGNPAHSKCKPPPCQSNCNPCQVDCDPGCKKDCNPGCKVNCNPGCQVNCNPGCQVDCTPGCQTDCNPGCQGADCDEDEDDVLGKIIRRAMPAVRSESDTVQGVRSAALPFTGASSVVPLLSLGLLMIITGALGVVATDRRRRRAATTT